MAMYEMPTDLGFSAFSYQFLVVVQGHAGYSRCGLGSDGTDRLVALVRQEQAQAQLHQEAPVLYGAKITGGGSGG